MRLGRQIQESMLDLAPWAGEGEEDTNQIALVAFGDSKLIQV